MEKYACGKHPQTCQPFIIKMGYLIATLRWYNNALSVQKYVMAASLVCLFPDWTQEEAAPYATFVSDIHWLIDAKVTKKIGLWVRNEGISLEYPMHYPYPNP